MPVRIDRRGFVKAGAAGLVAAARPVFGRAPAVRRSRPEPVIVASANGYRYRNGGPRTCVEEAFGRMTAGGDVLDALVAGVTIVELDPLDDSVGYGGLPNADGVVQLDASCMHGTRRRAGAVAALEGVRTPSQVARAVMSETDHQLLVGAGAQQFAREMGFPVEADLNTDNSRRKWLRWKRRIDPKHWVDPAKRGAAAERARREMLAEGALDLDSYYGTIHCSGVDAKGEIAGVTTTSGLAFKIPGRVGDSPIVGAGLYVDGEVGAAGSTGRGEANLFGLCSFVIVELMSRGATPKDAGLEALRRIQASTLEKRLLTPDGKPDFNVKFYVLDRDGRYAGVALWGGVDEETGQRVDEYAVCSEAGPRIERCEVLLGERAWPVE